MNLPCPNTSPHPTPRSAIAAARALLAPPTFAACLATPAYAELPLAAAETLASCWINSLPLDLRLEMLSEGGFTPVTANAAKPAAAAIAPYRLMFDAMHGMVSFTDDPAFNRQRLADAAAREVDLIASAPQGEYWLQATAEDGDAYIYIQSDQTAQTFHCIVALPEGDWRSDMDDYTGAPHVTTRDEPPLRLTRFPVSDDPAQDFWLGEYRPLAFGGIATLPILVYPVADLVE